MHAATFLKSSNVNVASDFKYDLAKLKKLFSSEKSILNRSKSIKYTSTSEKQINSGEYKFALRNICKLVLTYQSNLDL